MGAGRFACRWPCPRLRPAGKFCLLARVVGARSRSAAQTLGALEQRRLWHEARERPGGVMALRGKYERVIGTVASVGRTKSATYLNFGTDYRSDFTARVGKNVLAALPIWRARSTAAAKTVIVRGRIERRNGPLIDVADPSEIEVIDDAEKEPSAVSERSTPGEAQPARAPAEASPDSDLQKIAPDPDGRCGTGRGKLVALKLGFSVYAAASRPLHFRPVDGLWRSSTGSR